MLAKRLSWSMLIFTSVALMLFLVVMQTSNGENKMNGKCDFSKVPLNTSDKNDCSPDIDEEDDFVGIVINAPTDIKLEEDGTLVSPKTTVLPICGYYSIGMPDLMKDGVTRIFLENLETQVVFSGEVEEEEDENPVEPPPDDIPQITPDQVANQYLGSYFNVNIPQHVTLPNISATYNVYVTLGGKQSNTLTLKVHSSKKP